MKKFGHNKDLTEEVIDQNEIEIKEVRKLDFFKKHKIELIFGGLTGLATFIACCLIASKSSDGNDESDNIYTAEIEDSDIASEF